MENQFFDNEAIFEKKKKKNHQVGVKLNAANSYEENVENEKKIS